MYFQKNTNNVTRTTLPNALNIISFFSKQSYFLETQPEPHRK